MESLAGITIGQYVPGNSLIHRLDSVSKIIFVTILIIYLFLFNTYIPALFVLALLIFTTYLARLDPIFIIRGLKTIIFLMLIAMIMHILMTAEGKVLFTVGPLVITEEGFIKGGFIVLRLALLVYTTSLLTLTTAPVDLTYGIERLGRPFAKMGLPVHEFAMMTTIALRFIPTLIEEIGRIIDAQKSRCANFDTGPITARAKAFLSILIPLFIGAFRRADELASAMEIRCYHPNMNRTRLRETRPGFLDIVGFLVLCAFLAGGWHLNGLYLS